MVLPTTMNYIKGDDLIKTNKKEYKTLYHTIFTGNFNLGATKSDGQIQIYAAFVRVWARALPGPRARREGLADLAGRGTVASVNGVTLQRKRERQFTTLGYLVLLQGEASPVCEL